MRYKRLTATIKKVQKEAFQKMPTTITDKIINI